MDSLDQNNCCIVDFTYVPCADHKKPVCDEKGCGPVPPAIGFSYASPSSFDVDPVGQPINLVNHGCVNVLDKYGKDTVYNQFFISHCTTVSLTDIISSFHLILTGQQNIDGVELYTEPECGGLSSIQKNTAGCYRGRVGDGIRSFKILTLPGLMKKRAYLLGSALLNESDPFCTSAYPSQSNEASVTPAHDCFDEQTGAYILGCKIERSEASADALAEPNFDDVADDIEQGVYPCPLITGQYKHCTLKNAALVDGPETFKVCWLHKSITDGQPEILVIVCPPIIDRSVDAVVERSVNDLGEGLRHCPLMIGPYKKCHIGNATHIDGPHLLELCWLPKSPLDAQEVTMAIVCPLISDRSIDGSDEKVFQCPSPDQLSENCTLTPAKNPANVTILEVVHYKSSKFCMFGPGPQKTSQLWVLTCRVEANEPGSETLSLDRKSTRAPTATRASIATQASTVVLAARTAGPTEC